MEKVKAKLLWLLEKIKKYWYLVLFGIAATYTLLFAKNKDKLIDDMMEERDAMLASHNTRLQEIQAGIEKERVRREQIERSYNELIKSIEANKEARTQQILAQNQDMIKELVRHNIDNPAEMANATNRLFGVTIVTAPTTVTASVIPANPY